MVNALVGQARFVLHVAGMIEDVGLRAVRGWKKAAVSRAVDSDLRRLAKNGLRSLSPIFRLKRVGIAGTG